jgi:hypothetical protein
MIPEPDGVGVGGILVAVGIGVGFFEGSLTVFLGKYGDQEGDPSQPGLLVSLVWLEPSEFMT